MAEKYPAANVRYVEGACGDEGLDIFLGDLSCGPTVWQCKSFQVTAIGNSQKAQIRKSLHRAVASCSPKLWVLCLNMNFDTKVHRWFQRLQTTYAAKGVLLELVQGCDIIHELIFRHTLREHYFPNSAILDEVRKLVPRSSVLTDNELEPMPGEAVEEYIARLKDKDPRFIYELTIGGDRGPSAFPPSAEPGIVAAITDGRKTVKAFARDTEALLRDPVEFSVTLAGTGVEKMLSAIRTGKAQHFEPKEIRGFTGNVPLLSFLKPAPGEFALDLSPTGGDRPVPLRVSFIGQNEQVVYDLLEFEITRAGTHEVEIASKDQSLPFQIRFVFPAPVSRTTKVQVNFKKRFVGSDAVRARKALAAIRVLKLGCSLELFSLQYEKRLGVIAVPPVEFDIPDGVFAFTDRLARISEHFHTPIRLPEPRDVSEADFDLIAFLYALATGEDLPLGEIGMNLVKTDQNLSMFPNVIRQSSSLALVYDYIMFRIFGSEIRTGRCIIQLRKAEFLNPERALHNFQIAQIGEAVPLSIHPLEPARAFLAAEDEQISMAPFDDSRWSK